MAQQSGSETRAGIEEGEKESECVCVCSFVLSLPERWRPHHSPVWLVSHTRLGAALGCQLRRTIAAPRGHSGTRPMPPTSAASQVPQQPSPSFLQAQNRVPPLHRGVCSGALAVLAELIPNGHPGQLPWGGGWDWL